MRPPIIIIDAPISSVLQESHLKSAGTQDSVEGFITQFAFLEYSYSDLVSFL